MIKQISVFLENKSGRLVRVAQVLAMPGSVFAGYQLPILLILASCA